MPVFNMRSHYFTTAKYQLRKERAPGMYRGLSRCSEPFHAGVAALRDARKGRYSTEPIQQAAMHATMVPTSTYVVLICLPMIQYMKPNTASCGRHGMIMLK